MTADVVNMVDDEPLTLKEACALVFHNRIKVSSLRAERDRGNLVVEKIGRTEFVTRRAIAEMRAKCRVPSSRPAFGSDQPNTTGKVVSLPRQHGKSSMAESNSAQDALRTMLTAPAKR